jgi:ubiquinone/menaquinone biosynthesis C-methylase UbiE
MSIFKDNEFDCVLCNAVLEHDKFFWKSISEMKRVLKDNGLLIIGTPSYKDFWIHKFSKYIKGQNPISDFLRSTTLTFKIHSYPGDYYRFSEETYKDVFF